MAPSSVPFDRAFFENVLPGAVAAFCTQLGCEQPVVELLTVDGMTHYVNGISGVSDSWVALHTSQKEHDHAVQVFIPYQTIFRVEVHPESDALPRRLGFIPIPAQPAVPEQTVARAGTKSVRKTVTKA
jgi:hypothetical protein